MARWSRYKLKPAVPGHADLVVLSGAAALEQITDDEAACIERQLNILSSRFTQFGVKSSLELLTAIAIHLEKKRRKVQMRPEPSGR